VIRFDAKEKFKEFPDFQINTKQFIYKTIRVSSGGSFIAYRIVRSHSQQCAFTHYKIFQNVTSCLAHK